MTDFTVYSTFELFFYKELRRLFLVRQNVTLPVKDAIFQYIEVGFIPGSDLPKKIASE